VARAGILVNVPSPAGFALHKLVTSEWRIAAFRTKKQNDLSQTTQLLEVLIRDRPEDLRRAWRAAAKQSPKFRQQLMAGLAGMPNEVRTTVRKLKSR
jgi:hypothetical protein